MAGGCTQGVNQGGIPLFNKWEQCQAGCAYEVADVCTQGVNQGGIPLFNRWEQCQAGCAH